MPFRERGTAIPDASAGGGDLAAMFSRRGCGGMYGKHVVRFLTSATRMASEDEPMVCRMMLPVGLLLVLPVVSHGWEEAVSDGLVLHLDARTRADAADRPSWRNLVDRSDAAASRLHNFTFDDTNGWVGTGSPTDPFALRFDGQRNYVEGMCDLETSPITLEVWACVEGMANAPERGNNCRGATLIGNDFGMGGVSLMVHAPTASPLLLHGKTFSAFRTDAPLWRWHQFALTLADGEARLFVDGDFQVRIPAPRDVQEDHRPAFLLGAARQPSNDFVEADGLIGRIAIVRVYRRALAAGEIRRNFETDRARFAIASPAAAEPVRARPGRCEKWDYYYYPPRIGGTGGTGWPSNARQAFDGYPTDISQPYRRNYWRSELKADQPAEVTIAYPKPVEVTQYVHYFIEPAAWKQADVLTSADGETWEPLQGFAGLPPENPQVLRIDRPRDARFYRIVVRSLHGGAQEVMAHEIETYYEAVRVAVRPHEAHLDVYSREPKIEIGGNKQWRQVAATRDGIQYMVEIPAQASAMLVWDRIK